MSEGAIVLSSENIAAQAISALVTAEESFVPVHTEGVDRFKFTEEFQTKLAALCLRDTEFMARVEGLLKP